MRRDIRVLSIILVLFLFGSLPLSAFAATPQDWDSKQPEQLEAGHLFAEAAIVIDESTGAVLFSKNADVRMYPASTTKIMTLLLALESGIPFDTMVTIPKEAEDVPDDGSKVPVFGGEQMTFGDLLYGFMLNSGNDGSIAIAMIVSGSVNEFVALMNRRAQELGCTSTHFVNPHGYHDDNHYTTASDMAIITRQAMSMDNFREIVGTHQYTMEATARRQKLVVETKIELLKPNSQYYLDDCIGIKTGYHRRAGQCLVAAAERGGRTIITVGFRATVDYPDRKWYDAQRMFAFGFTRYDAYTVRDLFEMAGDGINTIQVENNAKDDLYGGKLQLILSQTSDDSYSVISLKGTDESDSLIAHFKENAVITVTTDYLEKLEARETIEAGSIIGTIAYTPKGSEPITGTLIASRSVELEPIKVSGWEYLTEQLPWLETLRDERVIYIAIGLFVLISLIIIVSAIRSIRRNRRRRRIYEQRRRAYLEQQRMRSRPAGRTNATRRASRYDDF